MSRQGDTTPSRITCACPECATPMSPIARKCDGCDSPNPPNRHLRAAVAPVLGVLRWAQRRPPGLPRVTATLIGVVVLLYPFGPLVVSWWIVVAFWWFLLFIGPWYRVALLVGVPVGMAGIVVLEGAGFDCSNPWVCMADAMGLVSGPVSPAGVTGVVLVGAGTAILMLAAVRAGRSG